MSTKIKLLAVIIAALLVAAIILIGLRSELFQKWRRPSPSLAPVSSRISVKPTPSISLQINSQHELTVFSGTPLIFRVRLGNRFAQNAALRNEAAKHHAAEIQAAISRGEISQEHGNQLLASLPQPSDIPTLTVGDDARSWESSVQFFLRTPDGQQQPLPWSLSPAPAPAMKSLTLDQRSVGQLEYLLPPAPAAGLVPGTYEVCAALDVPGGEDLSADRWHGRILSEPVTLTVAPKPDQFTKTEAEEWNLQFVRYFQKTRDTNQALQWDQRVLSDNPTSIPALVMLGELKEDRGDLKGALEAYQSALSQVDNQYPHSYEPPQYLIRKISQLFAVLRAQDHQ